MNQEESINYCTYPKDSIRQAMACINRNSKGIVLLIDLQEKLLGTITDGDIRRAILLGKSLDDPVGDLLALKSHALYSRPVTARIGSDTLSLLKLMHQHDVRQIPLLDDQERVVDLVSLQDLLPGQDEPFQAVVMAGGFGVRLRPLTDDMPKPMLPVGDRPLLELIIEQLRSAGIRQVNVTTHYKAEKIIQHFGDGSSFGVELNYVSEDRPMGTAGALSLIEKKNEPLLVVNGDILTGVDFRSMLSYHRENHADLTVAVRKFDIQVPYGVIECNGSRVESLSEKPLLSFFVNAGIYFLEPSVHRYIPDGEYSDMTDLIRLLLKEKKTVISFPIMEYWLDVGQPIDYEQAQEDMMNGKFKR